MLMRFALAFLVLVVVVDAFSPHKQGVAPNSLGTAVKMSFSYANVNDTASSSSSSSSSLKSVPKSAKSLSIRHRRSTSKESAATRRWNQRFEELRHFHQCRGHFKPGEPSALTNWIRNQRTQYRYMNQERKEHLCFLTAERIQKLESLGFLWNPQEAKWKRMFMQLVEYQDRFGHCNVPSKWEENTKLAVWVSTRRFKYKAQQRGRKIGESIKSEQIDMLNSIGFSWDPKRQVWWSMYHALQEYKREHGNCAVPQSYPPNPALGAWVRHQRRSCRELALSFAIEKKTKGVYISGIDEERLQALRDIGFCWLPDPEGPWRTPPKDIFDHGE